MGLLSAWGRLFGILGIAIFLINCGHAPVHDTSDIWHQDDMSLRRYYTGGGTDFEFTLGRGNLETNYFLRQGHNQSHTVLTSGEFASVITAFPAGNSAVAIFPVATPALQLAMQEPPQAVNHSDGHGVFFTVAVNQASLEIKYVDVGSTRDVRDYERSHLEYADARAEARLLNSQTVLFSRERLDRKGTYSLRLIVLNGRVEVNEGGKVRLEADPKQDLKFRVEAMTSETPFAPLAINEIFKPEAIERLSVSDIQSLLYLINAEKIMAGSWRYQTYFGRDPLLTLIYLAEFVQPKVLEVELAALFERMDVDGEPAHEEDIGDIATRENIAAGRGATSAPVLDRKMVDTVFLVPTLFSIYLETAGRVRAIEFLARKGTDGRTYMDALRANFDLILKRAEKFAVHPVFENLIEFHKDQAVGDWRDSHNGHGSTSDAEEDRLHAHGQFPEPASMGGRYSFGVNVALVPHALSLAARFLAEKDLGLYDAAKARRAATFLAVWEKRARPLFTQTATPTEASEGALTLAAELGLPEPPPMKESLRYSALSLDRNGKPIRVINSDEGFDLLLNSPSEAVVSEAVDHLLRPFPYGLMSPVGMVVANPILLTDPVVRARFWPTEYHGLSVWGCDMVKMERGLNAQLKRRDFSVATTDKLRLAHRLLWERMTAMDVHKKEELWSWQVVEDDIVYVPYKEANAIQLWSLSWSLLRSPYANSPGALLPNAGDPREP